MFRASSAHLKEDTVVYMQHMVLSLWEFLVATRNSRREWQYHMLHVYNCILLKMSTWGSKHVEENIILLINNNQWIKLVINVLSIHDARSEIQQYIFLISDFRRDLNIVYFLLGISPASNCSWPTFRNRVPKRRTTRIWRRGNTQKKIYNINIFTVTGCVDPDSSVSRATRYGMDGPGIEFRWGPDFSAPVQAGPEAHPASYTMGTGFFPGVKRPGRGADHSPPH